MERVRACYCETCLTGLYVRPPPMSTNLPCEKVLSTSVTVVAFLKIKLTWTGQRHHRSRPAYTSVGKRDVHQIFSVTHVTQAATQCRHSFIPKLNVVSGLIKYLALLFTFKCREGWKKDLIFLPVLRNPKPWEQTWSDERKDFFFLTRKDRNMEKGIICCLFEPEDHFKVQKQLIFLFRSRDVALLTCRW